MAIALSVLSLGANAAGLGAIGAAITVINVVLLAKDAYNFLTDKTAVLNYIAGHPDYQAAVKAAEADGDDTGVKDVILSLFDDYAAEKGKEDQQDKAAVKAVSGAKEKGKKTKNKGDKAVGKAEDAGITSVVSNLVSGYGQELGNSKGIQDTLGVVGDIVGSVGNIGSALGYAADAITSVAGVIKHATSFI